METFSSETVANRNNSGKSETLNALQNDLIWLLLHSWFSFFGGDTHARYCTCSLITTMRRAENCVLMIQIIVIYLLSVCDCHILKTILLA